MSPPSSARAVAGGALSHTGLRSLGAEPSPSRMGARRKAMLVFAGAILLQYGLDLLAGGDLAWTFAIRLVWSLSLVASALLLDEQSESHFRVLSATQSTVASFSVLGLVYFTGGAEGAYFGFLPSLPVLMALIYPQDSRAVFISGLLVAVGAPALVLEKSGSLAQAVLWAGMAVGATSFGAYGAHQFRSAQQARAEARLERARREAMEQLAISERRRMQSEKLAVVGQLLAGVVHEVNNPLAFVRSNLDFLEREVLTAPEPSREELAEVFSETRTGVERIRQIVSDLKGFSHMGTEELAACALADVVSDATRLARLRLKHVARMEVDIPEDVPAVRANHRRLAQVLLNLLVNAGDALQARGQRDSELRISARREAARVLLLVEDNGPGFPPDVLPHLFEPFFTTKGPESGTGLGLALSREMVQQFGGTLVAENRAEGGARLRLELPVYAPGEQAPAVA